MIANSGTGLAERLTPWLWDTGWQAGLIGVIALLVATGVARRRPVLAYGIILLAMLKFLIPPLIPAPALLPGISGLDSRTAVEQTGEKKAGKRSAAPLDALVSSNHSRGDFSGLPPFLPPFDEGGMDSRAVDETAGFWDHAPGESVVGAQVDQVSVAVHWRWTSVMVAMYCVGLGVVTCWILISWLRVRRLVAMASPPDARLQELWQEMRRQIIPHRAVRLLVSDRRVAPLAFGILGPVVVFPRDLIERLDERQRRMVLAHELLHHRRRDPLGIGLELCVIVLWWFHPVAWLLIRSSRRLRERCCDDATVGVLGEPAVQYASALEAVARWLAGQRISFPLMSATMHPIGIRIRDLLHPLWETRPMRLRATLSLLVLWGLICLPTLRTSEGQTAAAEAAEANDEKQTVENETQTDSAQLANDGSPANPDGAATDRYGDPLPNGAVARLGTIRLRHTSSLMGVVFSPDGQTLASAEWQGPIRLWSASTGEPIGLLPGAGGVDVATFGLAFSPDGTRLASIGDQGRVQLWDIASGEEIWTRQKHEGRVISVAFFPGGATFATAGDDGTVRLWDSATGEELLVLTSTGRIGSSYALGISPDGSQLACGARKAIYVYDLETGGEPLVIEEAHGRDICAVEFTRDGNQLISAGQSEFQVKVNEQGERVGHSFAELRLWNLVDGSLVREFAAEERDPNGSTIALSSDGRTLVSQHSEGLRVWDVGSGKLLRTIGEYKNSFGPKTHGLDISPSQQSLVAAIGPEYEVMLWDLQTGERRLDFADSHSGFISSIACSPDGTLIASGASDGDIRIWESATGRMAEVLPLSDNALPWVRSLTFSHDGTVVAAVGDERTTGGFGGAITLAMADGTRRWTKSIEHGATVVAVSKDGQAVAVADRTAHDIGGAAGGAAAGPRVTIFSAESGERKQQLRGFTRQGFMDGAIAMAFAADASALRVVQANTISTWDSASGTKLTEFSAPDQTEIRRAAFSPDGTLIATTSLRSNKIILWDASSGEELTRVQADDGVSALAFSVDGALLAYATAESMTTNSPDDLNLHVCDISTGASVAQFAAGTATTTAMAFMPSRGQLVTGMYDGTVLVWALPQVGD